jgi:hypothetical protein
MFNKIKIAGPEFRILLGSIGFIAGVIVMVLSGINGYEPDHVIVDMMIVFSSGLLSLGRFVKDKSIIHNNNINNG